MTLSWTMVDWADSVNWIWSGSFHEPGEDVTLPELKNFKAEFFKALAHPLRISILDALRGGEKTVAEISEQFDIEPAYASQQLAVLRNRNIIAARKSGANVYYSVSDPIIFKLLDVAKEIFNNHLVGVRSMLEEIKAEGRRRK